MTKTIDDVLAQRARFLLKRLANRLDFFAVAEPLGANGPKVAPAIPFLSPEPAERLANGEPEDDDQDPRSELRKEGRLALVLGHLAGPKAPPVFLAVRNEDGTYTTAGPGRYRVGFYAKDAAGETKWTCVEFALAGKYAVKDAEGHALATQLRVNEAGHPCFLERALGGTAYRVWLFYEQKKPAKRARRLGLAAYPKNTSLARGGLADAERGHGVKVSPGRARDEFRSWVFGPWFHGAEPQTNVFMRFVEGGLLEEHDPWAP